MTDHATLFRNTRPAVRSLPCPECGAQPHHKCVGVNGKERSSCHNGRWATYREIETATPANTQPPTQGDSQLC